MKNPKIAFCITCKGRVQHIEKTLPQNLLDNKYENLKFVILNYNSQDTLVTYIKENYQEEIKSGRVVLYNFLDPGRKFNMTHAKNMVHRLGMMEGADILVNLDADNFTGVNFAEYIAEKFEEENVFLCINRKMIIGDDRLPRGVSGRIVVSSRAFLNAGGYDEKYEVWGPDDKDFSDRLRRMGYISKEIEREYLGSVPHNDKIRFREYPEIRTLVESDEYEVEFEVGREVTITNFGVFGCGTVFKNFESNPIILDKLPTRVFGIGMHKTGTTSLHAALRILGFDSAHWESAHWAKSIWLEMKALKKSQTIENHYASSDLPIALLYKELDRAYPGSKFILTTRNEETWIESVKKHWNPEFNKYRVDWDTDPFTHRLHKELYGQKNFDSEVFLNRFRKHNNEVKEYFKNRKDLLILDLDQEVRWLDLCGFLGKWPIPDMPYPKKLVSEGDDSRRVKDLVI